MKSISAIVIFLVLFFSDTISGQDIKTEIEEFIKEESLILIRQKTLRFTQKLTCDYYLINDSIRIGFDLNKVRKANSDNAWQNHRFKEAVVYLKNFPAGTMFHMDTLDMRLEYLIYTYALPNNKINMIRLKNNDLKAGIASVYSRESKKKPILFTLQDKSYHYLLCFSTIVCSTKHMKFR